MYPYLPHKGWFTFILSHLALIGEFDGDIVGGILGDELGADVGSMLVSVYIIIS